MPQSEWQWEAERGGGRSGNQKKMITIIRGNSMCEGHPKLWIPQFISHCISFMRTLSSLCELCPRPCLPLSPSCLPLVYLLSASCLPLSPFCFPFVSLLSASCLPLVCLVTTTSQPVSQPPSHPASHPASQPATQPASQPANQSANQPASQIAKQPAARPALLASTASQPNHSKNQENLQKTNTNQARQHKNQQKLKVFFTFQQKN